MQIEIATIYPPSRGRKTGTVVDIKGERYEAWPEKLDQLAEGHSYDVDITEREYDGRTIRKIAKVNKQVDLFTMSTAKASPSGVQVAPKSGGPSGNGAHPARDPDELAFINAVLPAMLAAGTVEDLDATIVMLKSVFKRRFGGGQ